MAGYYTSTRKLETSFPYSFSYMRFGKQSAVFKGRVTIPGDQTTLSFRSSGLESERTELGQPNLLYFPTGDNGHTFNTVTRTCKTATRRFAVGFGDIGSGPNDNYYSGYGPVLLSAGGDIYSNFPIVPSLTRGRINRYGSELMNSALPTSSQANLLLTLIETVREGLPLISNIRTMFSGGAVRWSEAHLDYSFGFAPLLSDIKAVLEAVSSAPEILENFRKDSGKQVRRTRVKESPRTFSTEQFTGGSRKRVIGGTDLLFDQYPGGKLEVTNVVEETFTFKGAFQYYLDIGDDALSKLRSFEAQANHLLGLRLTPELLWNLAPWSWLTDWFANIGTILGNASALTTDGLVLKYGYLMRHTVATRYLTYRVSQGPSKGMTWTTRYRTERKERYPATPYGFGLNVSSLSGYQIGILAALANEQAEGFRSPSRRNR